MEITLKDILTTYWAQAVLLLAAFGFLLKRIFDLRAKKVEVKHNILQQNRNTAITRFIDNYIELQRIYRQILSQKLDLNKIGDQDFIKLTEEKYEQLYASYFCFKVFLDPLEQARYADLVTSMQNIFAKIADTSTKIYTVDKEVIMTELKSYISDKLKENNENMKVIGQIFRENADKHFPVKL